MRPPCHVTSQASEVSRIYYSLPLFYLLAQFSSSHSPLSLSLSLSRTRTYTHTHSLSISLSSDASLQHLLANRPICYARSHQKSDRFLVTWRAADVETFSVAVFCQKVSEKSTNKLNLRPSWTQSLLRSFTLHIISIFFFICNTLVACVLFYGFIWDHLVSVNCSKQSRLWI